MKLLTPTNSTSLSFYKSSLLFSLFLCLLTLLSSPLPSSHFFSLSILISPLSSPPSHRPMSPNNFPPPSPPLLSALPSLSSHLPLQILSPLTLPPLALVRWEPLRVAPGPVIGFWRTSRIASIMFVLRKLGVPLRKLSALITILSFLT